MRNEGETERSASWIKVLLCGSLCGGLLGGRLGGRLGGSGAIFLLLLAQSIGAKSRLLLLLAEVELLVGVRRRLESRSEGGSLGRVCVSGGLLDLRRSLVDALELGLHEFAGSLVD